MNTSLHAPPPALVVLSGAARPLDGLGPSPIPLDAHVLAALPMARRVLAIACDGALQRAYCALHPTAHWRAVADLDAATPDPQGPHDLIVLGQGLRHGDEPLAVFDALASRATEDATLVLQIDNRARLSVIERLFEADCTEPIEPGDTARQTITPATVYKRLMDAGWMPTIAAQRHCEPVRTRLASAALAMADALDIPRGTATRLLCMEQIVISAKRCFGPPTTTAAVKAGRFSVIVPTTREGQLQRNVEASPGLHEVGARIVSYRHARSPAEALEAALALCERDAAADADWVLLCHQDVYFPRGFGHRLAALLAEVAPEERDRTLIGFAGMAVDAQRQGFAPAGFVIDRLDRVDHAASASALSLDELAIVVSRRSIHRIDPALGWHLWATDLCLTAVCTHRVFPRIVRLPLFHNSVNDYRLPRAFFESAALLKSKHAGFGPIPTLCGTIDDAFIAAGLAADPRSTDS